jgi:hypothetical protein
MTSSREAAKDLAAADLDIVRGAAFRRRSIDSSQ